ncbi:unnamed protein product [Cuscuta epithymum]|jgi:insertion element IS1 protein InsB
MWH